MFKGSIVALVTPFKNGKVDKEKIKELVGWHIESGTNAIVPCGTTGESATLSHEEHIEVIDTVIKASKGRVPVIAGTGSNNTQEALYLTKRASKLGADAVLIITPYYNKPTPEGLFEHYKTISSSVNIPIMLYNIASRTGINMEPSLVKRLSELKNIDAIKEASGNLSQMTDIIHICRKDFYLMSGDDALTLTIMCIGGTGVISVVANIVPKDVSEFIKSCNSGDLKKAREYHYKLNNLIKAMFIETNPGPVKKAMELMGKCSCELRLPLYKMQDANVEKLKSAMKEYGIL